MKMDKLIREVKESGAEIIYRNGRMVVAVRDFGEDKTPGYRYCAFRQSTSGGFEHGYHATMDDARAAARSVAEGLRVKDELQKQERTDRNADRNAKAIEEFEQIQVGDIFRTCWGYDQTNVEFYQIVGKVGKRSVTVRQIGSMQKDEVGQMSARVMPVKDQFIGEPERKIVDHYGGFQAQYAHASKWNGRPCYSSWYA